MEHYKLVVAVMATDDGRWGPRDAEGRRRTYTADELDALVELSWPWASLMGRLAAGVAAMRSVFPSRMRPRIEPTAFPTAEATVRG